MKYKCIFEFNAYELKTFDIKSVIADSLYKVKDGFWLTFDYKLTENGDEVVYWIPPSRIRIIKKVYS